MKNYVFAITVLALCSASFAQVPGFPKLRPQGNQPPQAGSSQLKQNALAKLGHRLDASDCLFPFASGTSNTFLSYCVSGNGNILSLETPQGQPQISLDQFEGYGICDINTNVSYRDFAGAGASANWGPATVKSHSATSVKIARTTSDGIWTLTQTITQVSGNTPNAQITMALRNNSSVPREAFLVRHADVDAAGVTPNEGDATFNTAFAFNSLFRGDGTPNGLALQNEGNSPFRFEAVTYNIPDPPDPCNPLLFAAGELIGTDASVAQIYLLNLGKAQSATMTMAYRGR
jgi:hypothetical protein